MSKNVMIVIIVLIIAVGGYFLYKKYFQKSDKNTTSKTTTSASMSPTSTSSNTDTGKNLSKTFTNNDLGVTLSYSSEWLYIDLGGNKNVTEPLVRENVAYFQIANENEDDTMANLKLLRYVIEPDISIDSEDDWYDYINDKVDNFIADETLSADYEPVSVDLVENIDGKYTVEEKYIEQGIYTGKDIYIYNGSDFYQFVSKIKTTLLDKYESSLDAIINSLKISNE